MTYKRTLVVLAAAVATLASAPTFAQTCASPEVWFPPPAGDARAVDTCAGDNSGAALMCGGLHDRRGPVYVFRSTFASPRTFTTISLSGSAPGFDPVMYMTPMAGGCGANQETCNPSGDTGLGISTADVPDGEWIFFVTAFDQNQPGTCGPIAITANGSYPVTLTKFTIE